jgi:DNA polymerase-3 subunit gamma/tau
VSDPSAPQEVAALYRRFRPGRFSEIRGQDHIVRALQGAVSHHRVVHAYLFSGPRGTGKTSTARVLAKALNCERPEDGDACGTCASCVAITKGTSLDVVELDAASNNGVDDIREIVSGAWHGTPGRWKVYIIDEVHMLSKSAEAAFLKTLEEPPPHVVFVLATTDPHKVVATIRSRTQHLEFRLFNSDTLSSLLHEVRDHANLALDEPTLAAAVRMGRGSARDALSALDQVLATGSLSDTTPPFDPLLGALASRDAVGTLSALAELSRLGWDSEQLAESLAAELRQAFLLQVAPDASDALDIDRERLTSWGRQLGLAGTVRALETVGRTLREMKGSPVPAVLLEVALVRLTRPELDTSVEALDERLTRLERQASATMSSAPPATPAAATPVSRLARTESPATPSLSPPALESAPPTRSTAPVLDLAVFSERFAAQVVPRLSRTAQIVLSSARPVTLHGTALTLAVPSESMRGSAERINSGLKSALEHEFKATFSLTWVVDATVAAPAPTPPPIPVLDEVFDDETVTGSEALPVDSVASHLITEAFPGAEEIG